MGRRNLILIHLPGEEYVQDFDDIAHRVHALDKSIVVFTLSADLDIKLPAQNWLYPTLTVALSSSFRLPIGRGHVLKSHQIEKLVQQDIFRKHGIPTPPALPYRVGITLDPIIFGDLVILKPMDLEQTSTGEGIQLFRRSRLHRMLLKDFPREHPIHNSRGGYIVQRFIDTGKFASFYRVHTFLQKATYALKVTSAVARAPLNSPDAELERSIVAMEGKERHRSLVAEQDVIALAEQVHAALPQLPMLGVDIVRHFDTGQLFVLECNPGGNTWHFSSDIGIPLRMALGNSDQNGRERALEIGRQLMLDQFGALDVVSEQLLAAINRFAT